MSFLLGLLLLVIVLGVLDARVPWPKPKEKVQRYVSIAERSTTLRRD